MGQRVQGCGITDFGHCFKIQQRRRRSRLPFKRCAPPRIILRGFALEEEVYFDENNINEKKFRYKIGYVPQESFLLDDTILNNICLNKRLQTDYLFKLVRLFCCDTFIKSNKDLNKRIGTSGAKLSGGQKQKLAILRAVINKPRILILDEATSELSANEESKIFKNLKKLKSNITIILISHNMNLKKYADRSLLISNNKVKKVS